MNFGQKIAVLMNEKGLTQTSLADALGIAQTSVSSWQRNASKPNKRTRLKLAVFFGVDEEILDDDGADLPSMVPTQKAKDRFQAPFLEHTKAVRIATSKKVASGSSEPPTEEDIMREYSPQMQTKLLIEISGKLSELIDAFNKLNMGGSGGTG
jgi:transcriptional regulator with XRE-family HTH domain